MTIDLEKAVGIVVAAGLVQLMAAAIGFLIFRTQASGWHKDNQTRFTRIENALGIDLKDDPAFLRRSEAERLMEEKEKEHERIWDKLGDHDGRINTLERKVP